MKTNPENLIGKTAYKISRINERANIIQIHIVDFDSDGGEYSYSFPHSNCEFSLPIEQLFETKEAATEARKAILVESINACDKQVKRLQEKKHRLLELLKNI